MRTECLRRVLDDQQTAPTGDLLHRSRVVHRTEQVDQDNGPGARRARRVGRPPSARWPTRTGCTRGPPPGWSPRNRVPVPRPRECPRRRRTAAHLPADRRRARRPADHPAHPRRRRRQAAALPAGPGRGQSLPRRTRDPPLPRASRPARRAVTGDRAGGPRSARERDVPDDQRRGRGGPGRGRCSTRRSPGPVVAPRPGSRSAS
jgi:hypothetical protein